MNICIFGLGYVGCVTGACLAQMGNHVTCVDINMSKIDLLNSGSSPIVEKDIGEIVHQTVVEKRFEATADYKKAVQDSDIIMLCVGTPSQKNGSLELSAVKKVAEEIGETLKDCEDFKIVVNRSTVLPGTVETVIIPLIEKYSKKKAGVDFGVCMNPEFLREGTSVYDFYHPPKNVIGQINQRSGEALIALYEKIPCPTIRTELKIAEMVKYCDNSFHALKISFANEIGNICKKMKIDSHKVMDIFCQDRKLNIAPTYLKPGFAFGGSCLPKDLRALTYKARKMDLETPVLSSILPSNKAQINYVIDYLMDYKNVNIGFLGLSFKEGTDDLRESPIVEVIERMIGKGFHVGIHDSNVSLSRLIGSNKEYITRGIPHISSLLYDDAEELIKDSGILVISSREDLYKNLIANYSGEKQILDLVRIVDDEQSTQAGYNGICW